jgi:hypothetical protein
VTTQTFRLPAINRERIADNLRAFVMSALPGKELRVEVCEYRKRRSAKQRGSLFGPAYGAIMEFCGYEGDRDKAELHRNMCGEFFGWRDDPVKGRVPVRTTTVNEAGERDEIDTVVALKMYAFIQRFAVEQIGCYVPDPDPMYAQRERWAA